MSRSWYKPLAESEQHRYPCLAGYVDAIGVEHGKDRPIGKERRWFRSMRGRNNLSALSQTTNLYFSAYGEEIGIFEPAFPSQKLDGTIRAILSPPQASNNEGYLDPSRPHAINHLVIDKLGIEEILVTAHDNGIVHCFMMREILSHLPDRSTVTDNDPPRIDPRAFFAMDLGESAWGIAVHSESRKLALSCNSQTVSVVEFSVTVLEIDEEAHTDLPEHIEPDTDVRLLELRRHGYNIPNVSFMNSDVDPDGRYLCSIDLSERTCLWDLQSDTDAPFILDNLESFRDQSTGWGVLLLDPSWFRELSNPWLGNLTEDSLLRLQETGLQVTCQLERLPKGEEPSMTEFQRDTLETAKASVQPILQTGLELAEDRLAYRDRPTNQLQGLPGAAEKGRMLLLRTTDRNVMLMDTADFSTISQLNDICEMRESHDFASHRGALSLQRRIGTLKVVPELGIVLVGCQDGFVHILSMVKVVVPAKEGHDETVRYILSPDGTLPFARQASVQGKKREMLHGMAVGPMQGRQLDAETPVFSLRQSWRRFEPTRRYRLMLEFFDGTVLSYQLCRPL